MNQDRPNSPVDRSGNRSVDRTNHLASVDRSRSAAQSQRGQQQRSRASADSAKRPSRAGKHPQQRKARKKDGLWTKLMNKLGVDTRSKGYRTTKKVAAGFGRCVLAGVLVLFIAGCLAVGAFGVYVFGFVDDSIDFNLNELKLNCATTIYVRDSETDNWTEYQRLYYEDRQWVSYNYISQNAINAFMAAEDETFNSHNGVNWKRTAGAFANMFLHFWDTEQGGSTITQQLVKNLTGDNDKSSMRKIREIMRARKLEKLYHKNTIMECYLNVIYLNNNVYGIEAAAKYYFDKTATELNVQEAASLAAITKSPNNYDPTNNMKSHKERRDWIIKNMYELNFINEKDYKAAISSEVELKGRAADKLANKQSDSDNKVQSTKSVYSYFTDTVIEQVIDDLMTEKDYTRKYAENMVFAGGLNIYATLDTDVQKAVDKVFTNEDNFSTVYGTKQKAQAAITVMDYEGNIVAIYGGRGQKAESRGLNRAYQSKRQPGSTMKPVGAYAAAIDQNVITWSTKLANTTFKHNGTTLKNYDHSTSGPVTVQYAVMRSLNLPVARVVQKLTPKKAFDYATNRFGLDLVEKVTINGKNFSDVDISPLGLGGLTYGVTTVEMAGAYSTFGNGGIFYEPTTYSYITSYDGKEIIMDNREREGIQAIGSDTAYIMNRLLSTVVTNGGGTGAGANFGGWDLIGKTGTTSDHKDRWFIGGSPYYMAAVWFGCDIPFSMTNMSSGTNPAQRLWKPVMQEIHKSLKKVKFDVPDNIVFMRYCTESGGVARSGCTSTAWGYFRKSYLPQCETHKGKLLSSATPGVPTVIGPSSGATSSTAKPPVSSAAPKPPTSSSASKPPVTSSAPKPPVSSTVPKPPTSSTDPKPPAESDAA